MGNPPGPWFDQSTWLRKLPDGHQQLLVNIVNPPNYPAFCNRVQTPASTLHNLGVKVDLPPGSKLIRAMHVSIDQLRRADHARRHIGRPNSVGDIAPSFGFWSIVVFELGPTGDKPLAYPTYELTTPIEDAAKAACRPGPESKDRRRAGRQGPAASGVAGAAAPVIPWQEDYAHPRNIDLENEKKIVKSRFRTHLCATECLT